MESSCAKAPHFIAFTIFGSDLFRDCPRVYLRLQDLSMGYFTFLGGYLIKSNFCDVEAVNIKQFAKFKKYDTNEVSR